MMDEIENRNGFKDLLRDVIVPKVEIIAVIILAVGVLIMVSGGTGHTQLIAIGLTTIAITFFLNAFLLTDALPIFAVIISKMGFISCSVLIVGIMYRVLALPGSEAMINIGLSGAGLAWLMSSYMMMTKKTPFYRSLSIRFSLVFFPAVAFYLFQ